jgi:uncharacterized protein (TIGR00251 family)
MLNITENGSDLSFAVRVQPRAAKDTLAGLHDGALKVRLCSPPVDGAANQALIKFLSKILKIPKSSLELVSGHKSRSKRIRLSGLDSGELLRRLGL